MRKSGFLMLITLSLITSVWGQETDSARLLQPVLIQAYASDRILSEVPASIGFISTEDLMRFNNTSILPAINTVAGVRMEERSPGSYRFSIRGSLLRSPFGVRNVKMYWNGLPLTDGGGNTYLNLLDIDAIGSLEIIKGPGGSLYGAGTGGVVLLNGPRIKNNKEEILYSVGSFGLRRFSASAQFHTEKVNTRFQFVHQNVTGYREQSSMRRSALNADVTFLLNSKSTLSTSLFYTDLFYETPGGLTQAQYDTLPEQARPTVGFSRGAVDQKTYVQNKTPYASLSYGHEWNEEWSASIGVFSSYSKFVNPAIRQYEERRESNSGVRLEVHYKFGASQKNKFVFGNEYQYFTGPIDVFGNNYGVKDTVQTKDDLTSRLFLFFSQVELELAYGFFLTAGASLTSTHYDYLHKEPIPAISQSKEFKAEVSPRLALLKKFPANFSVFASVSRGFSPPSLAEVRPSTNNFNDDLEAESGVNAELGFRKKTTGNKFTLDVTLYDFRLKETIVIQRTDDGAEYFINSGETTQQGIEASFSWNPVQNGNGFLSDIKFWNSYAYNHYRFDHYIQDDVDYSGNKLTGVPPVVNVTGLDLTVKKKFYVNATANYVDHIPLNDANSAYANEYFLLGARLGYKITIGGQHTIDVFAGIDNVLDRKYSLGNDLNALGGRYFNAAPTINYFAGLKFTFNH